MRRRFILGLVPMIVSLAAAGAGADEESRSGRATVSVSETSCTTEPAPVRPQLRVSRSGSGRIRVRVVGPGEWCHGGWSVAVHGDRIDLSFRGSDVATACGTCAAVLLVAGLDPGSYEVRLEGVHRTVTVR